MSGRSRKNPVLANPFYVILMVVGTLFVITALGYLVVPYVLEGGPVPELGRVPQGPASRAFAAWLDRHAPFILGLEFVVMLISGVVAMITEDWFIGRQ